jgi:hypothetical protein
MSHNIIKYEALDIETIWDNNIAKPICIAITANKKVNFKSVKVADVDSFEIIDFLLEKCSNKKIYYVHNLTFEMIIFMDYLMKRNIKFKVTSANKIIYSAEIFYKKKKIKLRCSYRLTMLSLKNLAKLAEIEEKEIFPYQILTKDLKNYVKVEVDMFENAAEYKDFIEKHGENIDTYKILESYCKNDAFITKKSIITY